MQLKLKYPPTAEYASKHAEMAIDAAKEVANIRLDYSPASLKAVDDMIESMRRGGNTSEDLGETLFWFGCYVGEVFVRHAGGVWRNAEETSMKDVAGFPIVIQTGDEQFCNPVGKVWKRMDNGIEDYLPFFYSAFTDQPMQEDASHCYPAKPWWKFW